ncbi:hypothetical protein FRB90_006252 [Tulasnella sp. 427]|nr:hypothetical protein FRB90_006252 [Tulasnella sp. 427]
MPKASSSSQRRSPRQHKQSSSGHHHHHKSDKSGSANRRLGTTAKHLMTQTDGQHQDEGPSSWDTREAIDPNRKPDGSRFEDYVFFWKVDQPHGWASQWYWEPSTALRGWRDEPPMKKFVSCEHFMMYHKAILFNDLEIADKIMEATRPIDVKDLGRQVSNFDEDVWVTHRYDIVLAGNKAKFTAIPEIKEELLATGDRILVEASPFDKIYGIGFTWKTAMESKHKWGLNVLGNVLMDVRKWLRKQDEGKAGDSSHGATKKDD